MSLGVVVSICASCLLGHEFDSHKDQKFIFLFLLGGDLSQKGGEKGKSELGWESVVVDSRCWLLTHIGAKTHAFNTLFNSSLKKLLVIHQLGGCTPFPKELLVIHQLGGCWK